ncbi:unnamed protein product [Arctogadus glacialis]
MICIYAPARVFPLLFRDSPFVHTDVLPEIPETLLADGQLEHLEPQWSAPADPQPDHPSAMSADRQSAISPDPQPNLKAPVTSPVVVPVHKPRLLLLEWFTLCKGV